MLLYKGIKNSWYSIFHAVTKRTTNRQQTKNQLKVARNCFGSLKAIFWPQKMFDCTFFEHRYCIIWPLINENEQKLDKRNAKLCNTCFLSKKIYFQRHESH